MGRKFIDLTEQRFGRLVVVERVENGKWGQMRWLCKCNCGNEKTIDDGSLKSGHTKSCGCSRVIDLTGQRFGRLIVIERVEKPKYVKKGTYWLCKCDCGNEKIVSSGSLKSEGVKSCGCLNKEMVGETNRSPYGAATFNQLYNAYKCGAKVRNYSFELTKDYFAKITKQNCFYCGVEPKQIQKSKSDNGDYIYNGIDRVDNSIGYTEDNIIACCGVCNHGKKAMSHQDFLLWIERVYNHSVKEKGIKTCQKMKKLSMKN